MSKQTPKKINTSVLEEVFKKFNFNIPFDEFLSAIIAGEKILKDKEEAIKKEEAKKIVVEQIHPELDENETIEECLENIVDEAEWFDTFHDDENGMDDDGADIEEYFMVGNKLYLLYLHCEAKWVGDWSVRQNLPGEVSITRFEEIENFEVLEDKESYKKIKLL